MTDAEFAQYKQCSRSHPHENMDRDCVFRTIIARLENKLANIEAISREKVLAELARDKALDALTAQAQELGMGYPMAPVPEDTARLNWIEKTLFGHSWNGVIDSGSRTHWTIWSGWRHVAANMEGHDFRTALDKAILAAAKK